MRTVGSFHAHRYFFCIAIAFSLSACATTARMTASETSSQAPSEEDKVRAAKIQRMIDRNDHHAGNPSINRR